jgi:hypothetical protein
MDSPVFTETGKIIILYDYGNGYFDCCFEYVRIFIYLFMVTHHCGAFEWPRIIAALLFCQF